MPLGCSGWRLGCREPSRGAQTASNRIEPAVSAARPVWRNAAVAIRGNAGLEAGLHFLYFFYLKESKELSFYVPFLRALERCWWIRAVFTVGTQH